MNNKRFRITLLYVVIAALICILLVELVTSDDPSIWHPVNGQLEDWLIYPEELDPHDYKVDINKASAKDFEQLPGIGPARALAIVEYRESFERGFHALEDLKGVKGIGEKTFHNLLPMITLNGTIEDQMASGCDMVDKMTIRDLTPGSERQSIAEANLIKACTLLQEARELVDTDEIRPVYELQIHYEDEDTRDTLYCEQDWKACRWGGIQDGKKFGISLQAKRELRNIIDNSD